MKRAHEQVQTHTRQHKNIHNPKKNNKKQNPTHKMRTTESFARHACMHARQCAHSTFECKKINFSRQLRARSHAFHFPFFHGMSRAIPAALAAGSATILRKFASFDTSMRFDFAVLYLCLCVLFVYDGVSNSSMNTSAAIRC